MKKNFLLSSGTAILLATLATSSFVQPVEAASEVTIETVVFEHEGTEFTVPLTDFAKQVTLKSGDFYDFFKNDDPTINAVGLSTGDYIDFREYAKRVTFKESTETVQDVLNDLPDVTDIHVSDNTIASYQTINGYNSDGEPVFEEAVTPEVISID
ncbi:hypothetical protein [Pontibacillus marinus]|uniref:Uncharacterized protein n=1 Tax=Pontibacillus marinus BH030004 = DSM 16465 TaxID=1385511 RepID=A0A0A5GIK2_9BACI|nr:hypothetical protein [Pontibacillus marinus]KGX91028.1 hypothetical protein N783_13400 [Pontibacillus marinus BH030004 = DSM 16465]